MKLFNSLSRIKEEFVPIEAGKIKMYVCGQTVYDYCHLGHARKAVVFDMIRRWFLANGFQVTYVENITDIDDKIIKRAVENNESIWDLTKRFIDYMHEDFDKLAVMRPDIEPKATDYIPQIIAIISDLIKQGFAYSAANGDVYYAVRQFSGYGKLSGRSLDELIVGSRVEVDNYKRDPLDFVLWKSAKDGEPYWDSPFGRGRPGWHIECSAMAENILGVNFDIHGGGNDLQFPHHENEIAQSEAHNSCTFANYWLHNGFLNINDEKMSKSTGNFHTVRDVLRDFDAEVVRLFILKTHYRSPLNFDLVALDDAKNSLARIYTALKNYEEVFSQKLTINWQDPLALKFKEAMDDDFNTAKALSVLFELVLIINKEANLEHAKLLLALARTIGLIWYTPNEYFNQGAAISSQKIEELIQQRKDAKLNKNFALADQIRRQLLDVGIVLEDKVSGTSWRKVV